MHSIRTIITAMTVCVIVIAMSIAAVLGVTAIRNVGNRDADRTLLLLREIRDRERSRIILKSVISMADSLGMDVITEGVETEEQLRALTEMGCSHFQGYFFSRPIPVDEFEEKMRRDKRVK